MTQLKTRLLLLLSLFPFWLLAQQEQPIQCGTDYAHQLKMETDPIYKEQYERTNKTVYQLLQQQNARKTQTPEKNNPLAACDSNLEDEVYTLPIVVFIIHLSSEPNPGDGPSNPTDAQILQGLQDMNDAYRNVGAYAAHGHGANDASNPDRALLESVDVGIEFCLAQRDLNGNPTIGIYRIQSDTYADIDISSELDPMKTYVESQIGTGLFDAANYAHVWLHNDICGTSIGCSAAGVVVGSDVLNLAGLWGSSQNNSKTHVHEFGHYLGLAHTWRDGCTNTDCLLDGDYVCDTPPENSTVGTSCSTNTNSCTTDLSSGPFTVDQDDMHENYMDYSLSSCKNTFTQGQKDRMRTYLISSRASLLTSKACIAPNMLEAGITGVTFPPNGITVNIENNGNTLISSIEFTITVDGGTPNVFVETVSIPAAATATVTISPFTLAENAMNVLVEITQLNGGAVDSYLNNNYYCQPVLCRDFITPPLNCIPTTSAAGLDNNFIGISHVAFNDINQSSGYPGQDNPSTGYVDFASTCSSATTCYVGDTYPIQVDIIGNTSPIPVEVWIDYNNNGSFEDATEHVLVANNVTASNPAIGNVTIPAYAVRNTYLRMRVFLDWPFDNACSDPVLGQAEDYAVMIKTKPLLLSPKVFLQGAFNGVDMNAVLQTNSMIPLAHPYGSIYAGTESVSSIPTDVVDWVLVELRSPSTTIVAQRAAFLKKDGTVVDTDGSSPVSFQDVLSGNYYVAIRHRNHLGIMTNTAVLVD